MYSFTIPVPAEFSFDLCLSFLNRSPAEALHACTESSVVKAVKVADKNILFRVGGGASHLDVTVLNGDDTQAARQAITHYVTTWFDLATDLKPFYKLAAKDRVLKPLVKRFYGYRIVGQPDLFESLAWAVLGQQINLQFAYTLKKRFVEQYGERFVVENRPYYLFPTPQRVATLTHNDLQPLQFSRQKSNYIAGIAGAFVTGQVSKARLEGLSLQEAREQLMKIKGIGNWTANYALMKTFRYPDAFPAEDAGLHNALRNQLKLDRKPALDEVRKYFEKYRGWEAYATLYLWKSL